MLRLLDMHLPPAVEQGEGGPPRVQYDFFHRPVSRGRGRSGFAFVNLAGPHLIPPLIQSLARLRLEGGDGGARQVHVSYSRVQVGRGAAYVMREGGHESWGVQVGLGAAYIMREGGHESWGVQVGRGQHTL